MSLQVIGAAQTFFRPRKTIAFGTAITSLINPRHRRKTKLTTLKYTDAGTAHTLTLLRPLGSKQAVPPVAGGSRTANAYATAAVAAAGTSLILSRDPGNYSANFVADGHAGPLASNNLIASGDFLAVETAIPGVFYLATVSGTPSTDSITGYCTVTVTAAPTGGIPANAAVFFFGVAGDTDPRTGEAHPAYASGTGSAAVTIDANGGSIGETVEPDEPILFHSNNATATGILEVITGVYGDK